MPPPSGYTPPAPAAARHGGSGRIMIGGVSISTIAIVLRLASIAYNAHEVNAERDAAESGRQTLSAPASQPDATDRFLQAHNNSVQQMKATQQQAQQAQQQSQQQTMQLQQDMQTRSAAMRSMNTPTFNPAPPLSGNLGFGPMSQTGGGFGRR
jgi:Tfp pilus assembly protein PilE